MPVRRGKTKKKKFRTRLRPIVSNRNSNKNVIKIIQHFEKARKRRQLRPPKAKPYKALKNSEDNNYNFSPYNRLSWYGLQPRTLDASNMTYLGDLFRRLGGLEETVKETQAKQNDRQKIKELPEAKNKDVIAKVIAAQALAHQRHRQQNVEPATFAESNQYLSTVAQVGLKNKKELIEFLNNQYPDFTEVNGKIPVILHNLAKHLRVPPSGLEGFRSELRLRAKQYKKSMPPPAYIPPPVAVAVPAVEEEDKKEETETPPPKSPLKAPPAKSIPPSTGKKNWFQRLLDRKGNVPDLGVGPDDDLDEQADALNAMLSLDSDDESERKGSGKPKHVQALYDWQIDKIMKPYRKKGYLGVFSSDEIPRLKEVIGDYDRISCIINTTPSTEDTSDVGGHWYALFCDFVNDRCIEVYDSLAEKRDQKFLHDLKTVVDAKGLDYLLKYKESTVREQRMDTSTCGWFAMKFLMDRYAGKPFKECTGFDNQEPKARALAKRFGYLA